MPGQEDAGERAAAPGTANGAPLRGAVALHVTPGYQACTSVLPGGLPCGAPAAAPRPAGLTLPGTPPAAGRAWVPGCRVRTSRSVTPLYDGSGPLWSPRR